MSSAEKTGVKPENTIISRAPDAFDKLLQSWGVVDTYEIRNVNGPEIITTCMVKLGDGTWQFVTRYGKRVSLHGDPIAAENGKVAHLRHHRNMLVRDKLSHQKRVDDLAATISKVDAEIIEALRSPA